MKQYFYLFNYPPEEYDLCALEFKYLFHEEYQQCFITNKDIDVNISVFMKGKIDIWAISSNFDDLKEEVKRQNHNYQDFKVIYLKNPISHPNYQETLDKCKDISWFIAGSVNMSKPKHTIALTKVNDLWIIGYYHHGVPSWKKYDDKPNTFSNSLDIRLARTLINIAGENDQTKGHYDIAIIDIPYNLYTPITYKEQCDIINSARKLCNKLVLVSYEQMDQEIKQAGFEIRNRILRKKTEFVKFGRYIYVCY